MRRTLAFLTGMTVALTAPLSGAVGDPSGAPSGAGGPEINVVELRAPTGTPSVGPSLTDAPDGTIWLSWVELANPAAGTATDGRRATPKTSGGTNALRFATLAPAATGWSAARTAIADTTVTGSSADFPQLAVDGAGRAFAIWTDEHGGAFVARSADRGATWSQPRPWSNRGEVEKFSFTRLTDGRVLAAWLDGRARQAGGTTQQLFSRVLDATEPDELVDPSVCDCCQTALVSFLDGGALVAYRGRTAAEVRDIQLARRQAGRWHEPRNLNPDRWKIAGCPVNGPRLATDGSRVAAAWFTGADNTPRVLASYSPDAGGRWLAPLRVDAGHPSGHADVALLSDGALVVTWVETDGSIWLRRITPEFSSTTAIALVPPRGASTHGVPRLWRWRDYAGARTAAQLLMAYTAAGDHPRVHTLLITIPEGDLLIAEKNCDCAPTAEELRGFPIRGAIVAVDPARNLVRLRHDEVPGVFAPGTDDFQVEPLVLAQLRTGVELLGRIDRGSGRTWQLGNVQLAGLPVTERR